MRPVLALAAALAMLAACATGPATPSRVTLDRDLLTVRMSDASTCRGPAPGPGAGTGWSGRLQDCPWPYPYTVEIDPGTNPVRFVLQEILGDRLIRPIAEVRITGADGRTRVFQSPDPVTD